jgi:hypothetical protein
MAALRAPLVSLAVVLTIAAITPAAAQAGKLPVVNVDVGSSGVLGPGGGRYVTLRAGADTLVARIEADGGRVLESTVLPGRFTVPAVAYDGTADGLSVDGEILVLVRPGTFPKPETTLAVLGAGPLRLRELVTLPGDFGFDAISPDGATLYLIQYLSSRNPTRYAVRAYDVAAGRLLPEPIVDPREPEERMGGFPLARAWSPDHRWAYTLYDAQEKAPFVHALDTVGRTARCIDLDELAGRGDLSDLRLDVPPGGGTLAVVAGREPVAVVDTRTFEVGEPDEPAARVPPRLVRAEPADGGGLPWPLLAAPLAGVALALAGVLGIRARRRLTRPAPRGT